MRLRIIVAVLIAIGLGAVAVMRWRAAPVDVGSTAEVKHGSIERIVVASGDLTASCGAVAGNAADIFVRNLRSRRTTLVSAGQDGAAVAEFVSRS